MLLTWRSTVLGLMYSASAIARLLRPAAISRRTSTSRPVRPAGQAGAAGAASSPSRTPARSPRPWMPSSWALAVAGAVQGQQRPSLPLTAPGDDRAGLEAFSEGGRVLEAAHGLLGLAEGEVQQPQEVGRRAQTERAHARGGEHAVGVRFQ